MLLQTRSEPLRIDRRCCMSRKRRVPQITQRVFNVSVKAELLPWWESEVEPLIKERGQTRTAFIMDAVRYSMHSRKGGRNG